MGKKAPIFWIEPKSVTSLLAMFLTFWSVRNFSWKSRNRTKWNQKAHLVFHNREDLPKRVSDHLHVFSFRRRSRISRNKGAEQRRRAPCRHLPDWLSAPNLGCYIEHCSGPHCPEPAIHKETNPALRCIFACQWHLCSRELLGFPFRCTSRVEPICLRTRLTRDAIERVRGGGVPL